MEEKKLKHITDSELIRKLLNLHSLFLLHTKEGANKAYYEAEMDQIKNEILERLKSVK